MKTGRIEKNRLPLLLAGLYAACVLIRCLLALATSFFPTVYVDEFLYYSMARSIATQGKLLYYGQPALYNYVVYPLALSPVYKLFPTGTDFYRVLQCWNIAMMSLSVFPIYCLCQSMLDDRRKALGLTAVFMLLPDFVLGQFILSEALIYPLFYTLLFLIYRSVKDGCSFRDCAGVGVLGGLLYQTKPGMAAPAAAALLFFLAMGIRRKNKKEILAVGAGVAALAAVYFLFKLIAEKGLAYSGSFFSIYDQQLNHFNGMFYDTFFRSVGLYPCYFILSCGVLPVLWGIRRFSVFRRKDQQFYLLMLAIFFILVLGIAWMINRPENDRRLNLRYLAMFMPLSLLACLLPPRADADVSRPASGKTILLLTGITMYVTACVIFFGSQPGSGNLLDAPYMESLSMVLVGNTQGIAAILLLLLSLASLYGAIRYADQKKPRILCCAVFTVILLVNTCSGYYTGYCNADTDLAKEAFALQMDLNGEPYVYVYVTTISDSGLDVNTNQNNPQVPLYEMYSNFYAGGGVYTPFVPGSQRGMTGQLLLPDTHLMILDENVIPLIKFSSAAVCAPSSSGHWMQVRFEPGARIVDSIIANADPQKLDAYDKGYLSVYNPDWLSGSLTFSVEIESGEEQTLTIYNQRQFSIPLYKGKNTYNIVIEHPEPSYTFTVSSSSITIHRYEINPAQ